MPVYKDAERGAYYVQCAYHDDKGVRHRKTKRGFTSKREAQSWERDFIARSQESTTMMFGTFCEAYERDMKPRLKYNTWVHKDYVIKSRILPFFENMPLEEIAPSDIMRWQNMLLSYRDQDGKGFKPTYLRSLSSQLSALFNHAIKYRGLKESPMGKVERIGTKKSPEMDYWTREEFLRFSDEIH